MQSRRPLPDGWVQHFDSQRKMWYYVDLDSDPPRVAFVHPLESQKVPSSAPGRFGEQGARTPPIQRPAGPREGSLRRRPRRATVAQQLYASALPATHNREIFVNGANTPSDDPPGQNMDSNALNADTVVSSNSSSLLVVPTSSSRSSIDSSGNSVAATSPTSSRFPTQIHLDVRNPRNPFDCTRLVGSRRVTYSGPQPRIKRTLAFAADAGHHDTTSPAPVIAAQSLYHHSTHVNTASPNSHTKEDARHPTQSTSARKNMKAPAIEPNEIISVNFSTSEFPLPPSRLNPIPAPSQISTSQVEKGYTAIVSDDLSLNPNSLTESFSRPLIERLDTMNISSRTSSDIFPRPRPLPAITTPNIGGEDYSRITELLVQHPKPIKPMTGVTLNLQFQVAAVSSGPEEESAENGPALKKRLPLLTSFKNGMSAKAKGKRPIRTIQDAESLGSSPVTDTFSARMDTPLVLIEG